MPASFNLQTIPFSLLSEAEQEKLLTAAEYMEFAPGEVLIDAGDPPRGVFVIYSGKVAESDHRVASDDSGELAPATSVFMYYEAEEYFGGWSIFNGKAIHRFYAVEATSAFLIPTATLFELIDSNPQFAEYFQQTLGAKREIVAQHAANQDMAEFMLARIKDSTIREPLIVAEGVSIEAATRLMREEKSDCLLARKGNRYGMVTGTDLLDAVILNKLPQETPVAEIASYRLISIQPDDYLFNALIIMTRQHIERVVVRDDKGELCGIIELTDVLSYFSSHSHVIGLRVERAQTIEELREASFGLFDLIKALLSSGVKIRFTMELLAAVNSRILSKLFDLVVPKEVHPHVCLIVMGSEGRGEQVMKTDQDNGLIYRDGLDWPDMHKVMQQFSETLISFGFPPCPGKIMVSNPEWVNSVREWTGKLSKWSRSSNPADMMNLAIAADGKPVAGNTALFKVSRNAFMRQIFSDKVFFSYFARAALDFQTPLTFFGQLKTSHGLDIKKAGVFPIVHGVRTMALQNKIIETNTFKRLELLAERKIVEREMAANLAEALSFFIQLRLQQQIQRVTESGQTHDETPNEIDFKLLNKFERELLRDSLAVVKDFKKSLQHRYHITL